VAHLAVSTAVLAACGGVAFVFIARRVTRTFAV
jgi:hypothetical protein